MNRTDYVLTRAAAAYQQNNGVLPLDMAQALNNAGLVIEDVITYIEESTRGEV